MQQRIKFKAKYAVGVISEPASVSMSPEVAQKIRDGHDVWQKTATDLIWDEALIEEDWVIPLKPQKVYHIKGRIISREKGKSGEISDG